VIDTSNSAPAASKRRGRRSRKVQEPLEQGDPRALALTKLVEVEDVGAVEWRLATSTPTMRTN